MPEMTQNHTYKTEPFDHQRRIFNETALKPAYGLLWEQGCGKTKPIIDTCAYLYLEKKINAMLVLAPAGVERNWASDEIPAHMPKRVNDMTFVMLWESKKSRTKAHGYLLNALLAHPGLSILCMSYHAFMTEPGKRAAWRFLKEREVLYVLDESDDVKTPKAKRTQSVVRSGRWAKYRRILTGTPADKPFDIYSQLRFLDPFIWKVRKMKDFHAFKQHYGKWETAEDVKREKGYDPGYDTLKEYKNLKELAEIVSLHTDRVLKTSVLKLPQKLYKKVYFEMTRKQAAYYNQLRDELVIELKEDRFIDGTLAIVRLLRLQQIVCGYLVSDIDEPMELCDKKNPRLDCTVELLEKLTHPAIIWSRFRLDIDLLMGALGKKACRYDGALSAEECERSKNEFNDGEKQFFVGNTAKGSRGLTLNVAKTSVYYSNSFKLRDRLQSEDRNHRYGQDGGAHGERGFGVLYCDVMCAGTVDEKIIQALRLKKDVASLLTGDVLREWI